MAAHALLGPSGADRWLNCPPSARASEHIDDVETAYAKEGTLIHSLGEMLLRAWVDNEGVVPDYELDSWDAEAAKLFADEGPARRAAAVLEMKNAANTYVAYVKERYTAALDQDPSAQIRIERRVDLTDAVPEGFGTADCSIVYLRTIELIDLKGGKGVYVSAFENAQTRLYAYGVLKQIEILFDIEDIVCTICQPRMSEEPHSERLTRAQLLEWIEMVIKPGAELAYAGGGEFHAGDWCQFCKLKHTCRARAKQHLAEVQVMFRKGGGVKEPAELTPAEIAGVLPHTRLVRQWCQNVADHALKLALADANAIPGHKVVLAAGNRKIMNEEGLASALKGFGVPEALIYERGMQSITALEGAVGKAKFKEISAAYVEKPAGKPALVDENDRRPPITSAAEVAALFNSSSTSGAANE